jgi:FkbM family methyltransferase
MSFNWVKSSYLYKIYFHLKHVKGRQSNSEFRNEVVFYIKLLEKRDLIFDIGANHGDKSAVFLKVAKKVIAFEPDKSNINFLNHRFYRNSHFTLVPNAVSDKSGFTEFFLVNEGSGLNTIDKNQKENLNISKSYDVQVTTLENEIKRWGVPDFIKIDVEGHELSVLRSLFILVQNLSFEANLSIKRSETIQCLELIHELSENYKFNYGYDYGLISRNWLEYDEMKRFIEISDQPYYNIYCKLISNVKGE